MAGTEYLRTVLRGYRRGAITDSELPTAVFPALSTETLDEFLTITSPDVLGLLKAAAEAAPKTDPEWGEHIPIMGGTFDARDADTWRQADADQRQRYRRGVETLRQHLECA